MATLVEVTNAGAVDVSYITVTDLSADQYKAVVLSAAKTVALAGANARVIGILQNAPLGTATAPAVANVRVGGNSKLKVNEACGPGRLITSTAAGLGEVVDADAEFYFAQCLEYVGGAQNDLVSVVLCKGIAGGSDAA